MQSNAVQFCAIQYKLLQCTAIQCKRMHSNERFLRLETRVTRGNGRMSSGWGAWMVLAGEQPAQVPGNPDIYCDFTIQLKLNRSSSSRHFDSKNVPLSLNKHLVHFLPLLRDLKSRGPQ